MLDRSWLAIRRRSGNALPEKDEIEGEDGNGEIVFDGGD